VQAVADGAVIINDQDLGHSFTLEKALPPRPEGLAPQH